MNELKVFTVAEANVMLPKLTSLIDQLRAKRDEMLKFEVEIDAFELISENTKERVSSQLQHKIDQYNKSVNHFSAMVDEIHSEGCFLKDIHSGLVDFYTRHEGQVVYLCWKYGEPKVAYWHEIGKGYSSRQPLK